MKAFELKPNDYFQFPGEDILRFCINTELLIPGECNSDISCKKVRIHYPILKYREIESNAEITVIRLNL